MRDVEREARRWIDWYDNRRLLARIGYIPPTEAEPADYANHETLDRAA